MTNVLEAQSINRSFGGIHAVVDVNLCLVSGEIRAVIGPNGAGKTTLVGLLAGSLKPHSGEICLAQQDGFQQDFVGAGWVPAGWVPAGFCEGRMSSSRMGSSRIL